MTNTELIKALRCDGTTCRDECPYSNGREWCDEIRIIKDAADALEAAEQRIAELEAQNELKDGTITAMATDIGKLQAQLPKEGEWIWENYYWHCSVCGENPTRGMGYVQGKNELFKVCPYCGARMKTVTECHTLKEGER